MSETSQLQLAIPTGGSNSNGKGYNNRTHLGPVGKIRIQTPVVNCKQPDFGINKGEKREGSGSSQTGKAKMGQNLGLLQRVPEEGTVGQELKVKQAQQSPGIKGVVQEKCRDPLQQSPVSDGVAQERRTKTVHRSARSPTIRTSRQRPTSLVQYRTSRAVQQPQNALVKHMSWPNLATQPQGSLSLTISLGVGPSGVSNIAIKY